MRRRPSNPPPPCFVREPVGSLRWVRTRLRGVGPVVLGLLVALGGGCSPDRDVRLLNVSYDPTRELYAEFNAAFTRHWEATNGSKVRIQLSHGGSSKQARSVIDGLPADVVTLALAYDVDLIARKGRGLPEDWRSQLPHNSAPYTSTIVFLVRRGNPKGIRDWDDLVKPGVAVLPANPKTSGAARWAYLAAWGYALRKHAGDASAARDFVARLYRNVPVLDSGARGASTTFIQRGIGDVLVCWENEAHLARREFADAGLEIVMPSVSILAEPAVALVEKVARSKGTHAVARAYLEFHYSDEGQEIAARHFYRPRSEKVRAQYAGRFPAIELFSIDDVFGGWQQAQAEHFSEGGIFDQISGHHR